MTTQETINKAVAWALGTAEDASHGYDQANRWSPDYDCSSFVISAWQNAGVPVKTHGASYTGDMYFAFLNCGFKDVTNSVNLNTGAGLEKGDVLLNKQCHTEMYVGNGRNVKASINELGTISGGKPGDQTGKEIYVGPYYNYPWDCVLRYKAGTMDSQTPEPVKPTCLLKLKYPELQRGDKGDAVRFLQTVLPFHGSRYKCGVWGADGDFGEATQKAVEKFQKDKGLVVDSIVGEETWYALLQL